MPELIHTFHLPVPIERAWAALDDPDLVASVFPGARVDDRDDDSLTGELAVKVGPVTARYAGSVTVSWRDRPARRFVLEVAADEVGGVGRLEATIHVTLTDVDGSTSVEVRSHLVLTGRVAQFGDGVIADVLERMLGTLSSGLVANGFPEVGLLDIDTRGMDAAAPDAQPTEPTFDPDALPDLGLDADSGEVAFEDPPAPDLPPEPRWSDDSDPEPEPEPERPLLAWPEPIRPDEPEPVLAWPTAPAPLPTVVPADRSDDAPRATSSVRVTSRSRPATPPPPIFRPAPPAPVESEPEPDARPAPPRAMPSLPIPPLSPPAPVLAASDGEDLHQLPQEAVVEPAVVEPAPVVEPPALVDSWRPSSDVEEEDPSLASKAAPYFVVLVVLWLLRRLFGGSEDG